MVPVLLLVLLAASVLISPVCAQEQWMSYSSFGPSYVSDTIPDTLLPGQSYPVVVTFRNTGLVSWQDEMRRIGLLYEGDMTKVTAIPAFVEIARNLNITPGKQAHFGLTLLPVGIPGTYNLSFSVVMRSATGDQKITETIVKHVTIVPTDGISSPVNGSVYVDSQFPDLDVYLDSDYVGNVPAIIADLKPGQYTVRVVNGSFERIYPVDVDRGVMTRVLVTGEKTPPVITRKKAGPISDGTLIGYIEVNIPLILIISLILLTCTGIVVYGVRKRRRVREQRKKEEEDERSKDPESDKAKKEKDLLDKIHSNKPFFTGLSASSAPRQGGGGGGKGLLDRFTDLKATGSSSSKPGQVKNGTKTSKDTSAPGSKIKAPEVEVKVHDLDTRPGSATANIGVANLSQVPVTLEDNIISPGGFGIIPVELDEPTTDEPEIILSLRFLAEGSLFLKKIAIPYNRGVALLARGAVEKAYEYFRSLLAVHPGQTDSLFSQAEILLKWGLEEEAISLLNEILSLNPDHEDALNLINLVKEEKEHKKSEREPGQAPKIEGYPEELSDRYTPIRILGDDPFAIVVLVRRNDNGELRALKIPHTKEKIGSSLYTEVSLLYQIRHPYVLRMFRAEFTPVVMLELEFVSGGWYKGEQYMTLSKLPVPLPPDTWLPLIEKIGEGLAYLHRQGVRHYHLSPKHILLDEPINPKISGLIRESLRGAGGSDKEEFFIMAPEQTDPKKFGNPGKKTDIYQLGAIWLWLVTGQVMSHEISGREEFIFTRVNGAIDPALEVYEPIFNKMTGLFKNDRYGSVESFLNDLKNAGHDASGEKGKVPDGDDT